MPAEAEQLYRERGRGTATRKGLDRRKVESIIRHYENQTVEEAIAEAEAAYASDRVTMMAVPVEPAPKVQKLIARQKRPA